MSTLPLVLLPGMMCDARLFAPQLTHFHGRREVMVLPITGHNSVEALAADVLTNAPETFALAGLSMGGIVAMEIVRQAPARVARLALLDTNPLAENDAVRKRRGSQIAAAQAGELAAVMRDEMKPNYLADGPKRANVLDLCMQMALDLGPEVFVRQSEALMSRPDQSETLRGFAGPALSLCGEDDRLCPITRHELMASLLPDCALEIVEGAGHLPTLERPDAVNAALGRWLERPALSTQLP